MSLIEQLARYMAGEGIGPMEGAKDGAIFYGSMPPEPQKAICVYASDLRNAGSRNGALVQIYVRSDEDGVWPLQKATDIVNLLDGLRSALFVEDGYFIVGVELESGPAFIGLEGNATQAYSINFRIHYC